MSLRPNRIRFFGVIARNRELSAEHDAAVSISAKLDSGLEFDAADETSEEKRLALAEHANVLIHPKPTTIAGVIALSRYVASLKAWQLSDDEDWHQVFLATLADAIEKNQYSAARLMAELVNGSRRGASVRALPRQRDYRNVEPLSVNRCVVDSSCVR